MLKTWSIPAIGVLALLLITAPATAQYQGMGNAQGGYGNSSLLEPSSGGPDPTQPPVYYPEWHNYLDQMQQHGGYYAVTGAYGNSGPVTSYYPASSEGRAAQTRPSNMSNMYYDASEYYQAYGANQGQAQAAAQYPQQYQQQQYQQQQQAQAGPRQDAQPQAQPAADQANAQAYASSYEQPYASRQQAYQQYQQQPGGQQAYGQPQQYQQQPAPGQQQYYQQQPQQQPVAEESQAGSPAVSDPIVQEARQRAYDRAVARQRAAELAAQQQAALQEMEQARSLYEQTQQKVAEQQARQQQFQQEYHRKQVQQAYDSLKEAQERYYMLQGVDGQSGAGYSPPPGGMENPASASAYQYEQQPAAPPASPGQPAGPAQQGQQYAPQGQQYAQQGQQYPAAAPSGPMAAPPQGQVTPLYAQQQAQAQENEGGGFWSTLKEIFLTPSGTGRGMFDQRAEQSDF